MGNNQIILLLVMLGGLVLAIATGASVARGDYMQMTIYGSAALGTIFALFLSHGWIYFAFLWACTCFVIRPFGFSMSTMEVACAVMAIYVFMNCWRKSAFNQTPVSAHFRTFTACLITLVIYCIVHFLYNISDPVHNESIAWTNASKQYLTMIGGFLLVAAAARMPKGVWQLKNPVIPLAVFLLFGLLLNIAIRCYAVYALGAGQIDVATGQEVEIPGIYIPIINLTDNFYALRILSPLGTLLGTAILTSRAIYSRRLLSRAISVLLVLSGLAGSILSGGRATLFLAMLMPIVILFARRRYLPLVLAAGAAVLFIAGTRILYAYDDRLVAPGIQRSLAIIPGMDMENAQGSIDSSSNWRHDLFELALKDWKQSPRTILSGRCVYEFTERDAAKLLGGDQYSHLMISCLRRGATHNLITDLLVPVGLLGFVLYLATYLSLLIALYSTKMKLDFASPLGDIRLVGLVALASSLVYGFIAGTFFQPTDALLVATLACASTSLGPKNSRMQGDNEGFLKVKDGV